MAPDDASPDPKSGGVDPPSRDSWPLRSVPSPAKAAHESADESEINGKVAAASSDEQNDKPLRKSEHLNKQRSYQGSIGPHARTGSMNSTMRSISGETLPPGENDPALAARISTVAAGPQIGPGNEARPLKINQVPSKQEGDGMTTPLKVPKSRYSPAKKLRGDKGRKRAASMVSAEGTRRVLQSGLSLPGGKLGPDTTHAASDGRSDQKQAGKKQADHKIDKHAASVAAPDAVLKTKSQIVLHGVDRHTVLSPVAESESDAEPDQKAVTNDDHGEVGSSAGIDDKDQTKLAAARTGVNISITIDEPPKDASQDSSHERQLRLGLGARCKRPGTPMAFQDVGSSSVQEQGEYTQVAVNPFDTSPASSVVIVRPAPRNGVSVTWSSVDDPPRGTEGRLADASSDESDGGDDTVLSRSGSGAVKVRPFGRPRVRRMGSAYSRTRTRSPFPHLGQGGARRMRPVMTRPVSLTDVFFSSDAGGAEGQDVADATSGPKPRWWRPSFVKVVWPRRRGGAKDALPSRVKTVRFACPPAAADSASTGGTRRGRGGSGDTSVTTRGTRTQRRNFPWAWTGRALFVVMVLVVTGGVGAEVGIAVAASSSHQDSAGGGGASTGQDSTTQTPALATAAAQVAVTVIGGVTVLVCSGLVVLLWGLRSRRRETQRKKAGLLTGGFRSGRRRLQDEEQGGIGHGRGQGDWIELEECEPHLWPANNTVDKGKGKQPVRGGMLINFDASPGASATPSKAATDLAWGKFSSDASRVRRYVEQLEDLLYIDSDSKRKRARALSERDDNPGNMVGGGSIIASSPPKPPAPPSPEPTVGSIGAALATATTLAASASPTTRQRARESSAHRIALAKLGAGNGAMMLSPASNRHVGHSAGQETKNKNHGKLASRYSRELRAQDDADADDEASVVVAAAVDQHHPKQEPTPADKRSSTLQVPASPLTPSPPLPRILKGRRQRGPSAAAAANKDSDADDDDDEVKGLRVGSAATSSARVPSSATSGSMPAEFGARPTEPYSPLVATQNHQQQYQPRQMQRQMHHHQQQPHRAADGQHGAVDASRAARLPELKPAYVARK